MVIYIELILLYDFLITLVFLRLINITLNIKDNILINILLSFISSLYFFTLYFYNIYIVIRYFGGIILIILDKLFLRYNMKIMFVKCSSFYILYFILSEITSLLNITYFNSFDNTYILFILLFIYITQILLNFIKLNGIFISNKTYDVLIITNNKKLKLKGFYDSGNLIEYMYKPVIIVSTTFYDESFRKVGEVLINQVGNKLKCSVYMCNKVIINKVRCDCYLLFLDDIKFDCILNSNLK